jgi:hypothetical protein
MNTASLRGVLRVALGSGGGLSLHGMGLAHKQAAHELNETMNMEGA